MSEKESHITPNSFQTPNSFVDEAMHLLTSDEYKVLSFIDRHILGWQEKVMERKGVISLTMLVKGYQSKKTGRWFHGTGLSRPTVNKCLDALTAYGFIVPEGTPGPKGQTWVLGDYPDYNALRERSIERQEKNDLRMARVRGKSDLPVNDIDGAEVNVIDPEPSIYDLRKQRHLERQNTKTKENYIAPADANAGHPDDLLLDADEMISLPKGKKAKAKQTANAEKHLTQTTATTPPVSVAPPKDKRPSRLEWAVKRTFQAGGMTNHLIAQMCGVASKGTRKEFNFETPVTVEEVYYFKNWYTRKFPQSSIPTSAEALYERFAQMRGSDGYETALAMTREHIEEVYTRETCPPEDHVQRTPWGTKLLSDEERASPESVAEIKALLRSRHKKEDAS